MEKLLEMNNFFKNIIIGLFSVRSNLTRVILTASGLTIGIFTVSIVSAAVSSIDKEFAKSMDYYGNDKYMLERGRGLLILIGGNIETVQKLKNLH